MGGSKKGRGYMCTYGWFTLRFDRKEQNSVKQLSFNKKIKRKKKRYPLKVRFFKTQITYILIYKKNYTIFISKKKKHKYCREKEVVYLFVGVYFLYVESHSIKDLGS